MEKFKRIQNKINSLQHAENCDELSTFGQELLNELRLIKLEHSEMLDKLKDIKDYLGSDKRVEVEKLIKEATQL